MYSGEGEPASWMSNLNEAVPSSDAVEGLIGRRSHNSISRSDRGEKRHEALTISSDTALSRFCEHSGMPPLCRILASLRSSKAPTVFPLQVEKVRPESLLLLLGRFVSFTTRRVLTGNIQHPFLYFLNFIQTYTYQSFNQPPPLLSYY